MKGFLATNSGLSLTDQYPNSAILQSAIPMMTKSEKEGFLRLWISEGIPFAFKEAPIHFENLRTWLAHKLEIHPKCITAIGSGRIGFSMAPPPEYGTLFQPEKSDLD